MMLLPLTSESEANLLLQIAVERMFLACHSFKTMTTTAHEEDIWLRHMSQEIAFQNDIISTIHFSQWIFDIEPFIQAMRIHFTRCLRRDKRSKPLPDWEPNIQEHFHRTNGHYMKRHGNAWWNKLKPSMVQLQFNATAMIELYMYATPSPLNIFDAHLAVERQVLWLTSKLPQNIDGQHVLSALEALQSQFDSNRQSCLFKLSGVERKYEQAYSLE